MMNILEFRKEGIAEMDATTYEKVADRLQEKIDAGELTLEQAQAINDRAYEQYMAEAATEAETEDDLTLEEVMSGIDDYLIEKACKVCDGSSVIGADAKSDAKSMPEKQVAKTPISADESNANPDKGLGSKTLSPDIAKLISVGDSQKEDVMDVVESVNALRLRVFDAYETGLITAEEKAAMLDDLNLDNYVEVDE